MNVTNIRDESQIASGRLFLEWGPARGNDLSPKAVCVLPLTADLIPGRQSTLEWQNSARYSGARPLTHLCIRVARLYVTCCQICNQTSGETWGSASCAPSSVSKWLALQQHSVLTGVTEADSLQCSIAGHYSRTRAHNTHHLITLVSHHSACSVNSRLCWWMTVVMTIPRSCSCGSADVLCCLFACYVHSFSPQLKRRCCIS